MPPGYTIRPPLSPNSALNKILKNQFAVSEQFNLWENAETSFIQVAGFNGMYRQIRDR
jgi:hypothetical protein